MSSIKLIVGLANPGQQYEQTRHNVGAWFIAALAHEYNITLKEDKRFFGFTGKGLIGSGTKASEVRLLIPTTFMNLSGQSIAATANFYKWTPDNILVAHDELDLSPGQIRLKQNGGHGGHNGLRNTIAQLGNQKNFYRLRIGIGHPGDKNQVTGYVLGQPAKSDKMAIETVIQEAVRMIEDTLHGEHDKVMQHLHSLN